jgi:hypothetical protein
MKGALGDNTTNMMRTNVMRGPAGIKTGCGHIPAFMASVVARLDRAIQYSAAAVVESRGLGLLDTPPEPVIGLAEGETQRRGMTAKYAAHERRLSHATQAFFFTSLMLEKVMPSARSLV